MFRSRLAIWLVASLLPCAWPAAADDAAQSRVVLARAQQLLRDGNVEEAIDGFERANKLAGKKSPESYLGLAYAKLTLGEFKDAAKDAKNARKHASSEPQLAQAHYFLGTALLGQERGKGKKLREAVKELRFATEKDATQAAYHYQLGVALLRNDDHEAGIAALERFLELDPDSAKAPTAREHIEHPPSAEPNYAPAFEVVAESGRVISRESERGRVVLLDFWATWCPPCVESLPDLRSLAKKYPADQFTLLSVSVDRNESAWREFMEENDMNWEQTRDELQEIARAFLPERYSIPCYIVMDRDGVVREVAIGDQTRTWMKLRRAIEKALE